MFNSYKPQSDIGTNVGFIWLFNLHEFKVIVSALGQLSR